MRVLSVLIALSSGATAWAVQVGDTRAAVIAELGEPQNKMTAGAREILNYPGGRIVISQGLVSELKGSFTSRAAKPESTATPTALPEQAAPAPVAKPKPAAKVPRTAQWFTNLDEAKAAAAKSNKRILALFTGSDWCGPCQNFQAEVANDEQFAGIFSRDFVFSKTTGSATRHSPRT